MLFSKSFCCSTVSDCDFALLVNLFLLMKFSVDFSRDIGYMFVKIRWHWLSLQYSNIAVSSCRIFSLLWFLFDTGKCTSSLPFSLDLTVTSQMPAEIITILRWSGYCFCFTGNREVSSALILCRSAPGMFLSINLVSLGMGWLLVSELRIWSPRPHHFPNHFPASIQHRTVNH